jgi:mono/diheme cytochrome c family protein
MAARAKTLAGPLLIALSILVCAAILMVAYALWRTPTRSIMAPQRSPAPGSRSGFAANPATARELDAGRDTALDIARGSDIYLDNCAACHRSNGEGARGAFPQIAGNPFVLLADPSPMIRLVLGGSALSSPAAPSALGMPAFGWRLSDLQVAQLLTFIRGGWGNQASSVGAAQVASVRAQMERTSRDDRRPP